MSEQGDGSDMTWRPVYALGHSEVELERLAVQARLVDPITKRCFVEAGIEPGMRVLDVGSGVGDVAFLAAELVGPTGEVVGTDRAAAALAVARERAGARSLRNVSFIEGDAGELDVERPFDAVVGRYVLMHQPDPTVLLRSLTTRVRPGGVVVFHEPYRDAIRSFPPVPTYDRACRLVDEAFRLTGSDPLMGIKLFATFIAAGLPGPSMRQESVIAGGVSSSDQVHFEMDVVRALVPEMERLGIATAADVDADTLADRVFAEVSAGNAVIVGRWEIGAWSRTAD